jgi:hypothetical protein
MIYFMEVGGMEEGGMRIPPYNWRSSIKNGGMEESYLICIIALCYACILHCKKMLM